MSLLDTYSITSSELLKGQRLQQLAEAQRSAACAAANTKTIESMQPFLVALEKLRELDAVRIERTRHTPEYNIFRSTPGLDYFVDDLSAENNGLSWSNDKNSVPSLVIKYGYETPFTGEYGTGKNIHIGWDGHARDFYNDYGKHANGPCVYVQVENGKFNVEIFLTPDGNRYDSRYKLTQKAENISLREIVELFSDWLAKAAPGNEAKFAPILAELDQAIPVAAVQPSAPAVRSRPLLDLARGAVAKVFFRDHS